MIASLALGSRRTLETAVSPSSTWDALPSNHCSPDKKHREHQGLAGHTAVHGDGSVPDPLRRRWSSPAAMWNAAVPVLLLEAP